MEKLYIGFDLGDGETSGQMILQDIRNAVYNSLTTLQMPNVEQNKALPTVYAYSKNTGEVQLGKAINLEDSQGVVSNFKRRPSDLLPAMPEDAKRALGFRLEADACAAWNTEPALQSEALLTYKHHVTVFVNAVFENPDFMDYIKSNSGDANEAVVTIGHPTEWQPLDCAIYRSILLTTMLGKGEYAGMKLALLIAPESRSAFLAMRGAGVVLKKGVTLLIDVGSSTIDVTALLGGDSRMAAYNSGHNYLGARILDHLIFEWVLDYLKQRGYLESYLRLAAINKDFQELTILDCRRAKEDVYNGQKKSTIIVDLPEGACLVHVTAELLEELLNKPMRPALAKYCQYPSETLEQIGKLSYTQELKRFLQQQKLTLDELQLMPEQIILTGSASRMPVVQATLKEVFDKAAIVKDTLPQDTISRGLAYTGISTEKSIGLRSDIEKMLTTRAPAVVHESMPPLADEISGLLIDEVFGNLVMPTLRKWRSGSIKTFMDVEKEIERQCGKEMISKMIQDNPQCQLIIQKWLQETVGENLKSEMIQICTKYNISDKDIPFESLNTLKINPNPNVTFDGIGAGLGREALAMLLVNVVALVTSLIVTMCGTTILATILALISFISEALMIAILTFMVSNPVTIPIAIGLLGIAAYQLIKNRGLDAMRNVISTKVRGWDIPDVVRRLFTENMLTSTLAKQRSAAVEKVKEAFCGGENTEEITNAVVLAYRESAQNLFLKIMYIVESR